jgi:cytochrome P450
MTAVPAVRRLVPAESIGSLSAIYAHLRSSKSQQEALSAAIAERSRSLAADPNAPRDMLGAMLVASDPETGERLTERELKARGTTILAKWPPASGATALVNGQLA